MKKLLSLFVAVLITAIGFSQIKKADTQQELRKDDLRNGVVRTLPMANSGVSMKNTMSALVQDFEAGATLPTGWATSSANPWYVVDVEDEGITNHTNGGATGNVVIFDCWNYSASSTGYLITPKLAVSAGDAELSFWVNYYLISGTYGNAAELYVAVSSDNGATWTESNSNIIAGQHGAGWFQHTVNLANFESNDYTDDVVMVRLRGISDYGSYNIALDDFAGPEIFVPTNPDMVVMAGIDQLYTMLAIDQVVEITPGAFVTNVGNILNDATDLVFAVTGESYSNSVALTVPFENGDEEIIMASAGFTPASVGTYEFTVSLNVPNDEDPSNNSDATEIDITENELAYDTETVVGQLGSSSGAMLGNKFVFNSATSISAVKFYITDNITTGYNCTVKIIDFTGGVAGAVMGTSTTVAVAGSTNAWYTATFDGVSVSAGQQVLVMVDNISAAAFMALARDERYVPETGYASTDAVAFSEVGSLGFPNIFLVRVITGEPPSCATPTGLNATTTINSATLAWTSEASQWNIEWGAAGFTLGTGTLVSDLNANSYLLEGLNPSTAYAFYVQANCGGDGLSNWAGPYVFTTGCGAITSYPFNEGFENAVPPACWLAIDNDGDTYNWSQVPNSSHPAHSGEFSAMSASWVGGTVLTPDNWLVSPQFEINANNLKLSFWVAAQDAEYPQDKFSVMVSTTGTAVGDFTEIYSLVLTSADYSEVVLPLAAYHNQSIYIAIRHWDCTDWFQMKVDDFKIDFETGIAGSVTSNMQIYPNPSNGIVTITHAEGASIEIINVMGQVVASFDANSSLTTFDATNLSNGNYVVRIVKDNNTTVKTLNIIK